jgi:hypothetical protein
MLNDVDRNQAYANAVQETIAAFRAEFGRSPTVLDVGAGSGLLSSVALQAGASYVAAVEANETLVQLCTLQLEENFGGEADLERWDVVQSLSVELQPTEEPFDILISELFGSLINSESMYVYLWDLMMRGVVRNHGSRAEPRFLVVPQSAEMTATLYACEAATGILTGLPGIDMNMLFDAVHGTEASSSLHWVHDEAIKVALAMVPLEKASEPVVVLREQYNSVSGGVCFPPRIELRCTLPSDTAVLPEHLVVVLEWSAQLSSGVTLSNSLDHVRALPDHVKLARWANWGHLFAPVHALFEEAPVLDSLRALSFEVAYKPSGLDLTLADPAAPAGAASSSSSTGQQPPASKKALTAPASGEMARLSHADLAQVVVLVKALAS